MSPVDLRSQVRDGCTTRRTALQTTGCVSKINVPRRKLQFLSGGFRFPYHIFQGYLQASTLMDNPPHCLPNRRQSPLAWHPISTSVHVRPISRIFQKIRLAEPYFRLISGLAEFLRKLRNSAENTPEHHKFGQQDRQIQTIKFKI